MTAKHKTSFDSYFDKRMRDPAFAAGYAEARAQIDTIDSLVRLLDATRVAADVPKAELARRIDAKPEIIRRLFTTASPNPTMATVLKVADALGLTLQLVPKTASARTSRRVRRRTSARREASA
jgi:DNA-binding phage protein